MDTRALRSLRSSSYSWLARQEQPRMGILASAAGAVARASATRQVVARLSPSRFTSVARQRGAYLPDERLLNGEGRGPTRLVTDAWATAPAVPC